MEIECKRIVQFEGGSAGVCVKTPAVRHTCKREEEGEKNEAIGSASLYVEVALSVFVCVCVSVGLCAHTAEENS